MSCCSCFAQHDSEDEETDVNKTLNPSRSPQDRSSFQTYIAEDFANFDIYNATLESQDEFRSDLRGSRCGDGSREREVSRSPTASSCTSGYFSHSASNATLSDIPFSASESSEHLSCTSRESSDPLSSPAGRGSTQTKNDSPDAQQPPPSAPSQLLLSSPVSIPHCREEQHSSPHSCILSTSQEFTDFKGADDSIGEGDLTRFTEGWGQEELKISTSHQKDPENVESCDTDCQRSSKVSNKTCRCPDYELPVDVAVYANTTPPRTSVKAPLSAPDASALTSPAPSVLPAASLSPVRLLPTVPAQRAGGEPPIQEPAQGDLPHGSPCPSPNPSSAEPSGDSSGDESTPVAQLPDWMAPGEQVWVGKRRGTVYYVGGVEFAKGIWVGVKLDIAVGKSHFLTSCSNTFM